MKSKRKLKIFVEIFADKLEEKVSKFLTEHERLLKTEYNVVGEKLVAFIEYYEVVPIAERE